MKIIIEPVYGVISERIGKHDTILLNLGKSGSYVYLTRILERVLTPSQFDKYSGEDVCSFTLSKKSAEKLKAEIEEHKNK